MNMTRRYRLIAACLFYAGAVCAVVKGNAIDEGVSGTVDSGVAQGDPFAHAEILQVDPLVRAVLDRNPSIQAMEQAWHAALERPAQVTTWDDPMLSYGVAPGTLGRDDVTDGQKIELSQRIPWPGKQGLRGRIEEDRAWAAKEDVDALRERLVEQTKASFLEHWYVHRALEINAVNLDLLGEFQRIAESKYTTGTATKQDALQAEVERYRLEHRAMVLERMRKVSLAGLNTLLHRDPAGPLPPTPETLPAPQAQRDVNDLAARAANAHPVLRALVYRLHAAEETQALARRDRLPDFTVMGAYNGVWRDDAQRAMVGIGINLPLGQKKLKAQEAEARARARKLAAEFTAEVDRVKFNVTEAHDLVTESVHVVALYRDKFLPTAEENLAAARNAYESSQGDFLSLLTAEKNLMLVQLGSHRALADYHLRLARLEAAAGIGLSMHPPMPEGN